jgi:hypothetical protein
MRWISLKNPQKATFRPFLLLSKYPSFPIPMMNSFFTPAPAGLTPEQLTARQERERHANNSIAILMSNGPAPSAESLDIMQRYVDGELSLDQAIDLNDAMLLARYRPGDESATSEPNAAR